MTVDIHIPNIIPKKHTKKIKGALSSPETFFKLMKIIDKQTQGLVPFNLNPEQQRLLEVLKTKNKIIILKPRFAPMHFGEHTQARMQGSGE
jgi:hypothetical protein